MTALALDLDGRRYRVREHSGPRVRALIARDARGADVARLWWDVRTAACHVYVHPWHRRRGLATALYRLALNLDPRVHVSPLRTDDGEAWARSLGEPLSARIVVESVAL